MMRLAQRVGWTGGGVALVALLVAGVSGCGFIAGAALGGAGVAYIKGEASKSYHRSVGDVYPAAVDVLKGLDVVITEKLLGDELAIIKGRTAGGEDVSLRIERQGGGLSMVRLRVGLLGNKDYSALIFGRLDKKLGG